MAGQRAVVTAVVSRGARSGGLSKADLALAEVAEVNGLYLLMEGLCA